MVNRADAAGDGIDMLQLRGGVIVAEDILSALNGVQSEVLSSARTARER